MTRREALALLLSTPFVPVGALAQQKDLSSVAVAKEDLTSLSVAQASARLAARDVTPLELTNAYLARIASLNKDLNAYVTVTADLARREAKAVRSSQGPLFGIPIAHKDLLETRGVRTTAGSLLFEDHVPDDNAAIVQQLEDAGAVMLGKTNTHELGGGVTTINPFFGTTRNPVDRSRIAGGSSGGSAAAVVAHLCAAATGSDTGGSVRIPAAFCGCVGFKPTFGRLPTTGLLGASPTFDHVGYLTRTVEDAQLLFGVTPGVADGTIRVAVARTFFFDDLEPSVSAAVNAAVSKYPDIDFPIDGKTMARIFDPIVVFEIWGRLGPDWRTNPGSFSKSFAGFFSSPRPSIAEYESALAALKEYQAAVDKLFDAVDVIVTPTVAVTAPLITGPIDGMKILRNTWPFNAAGTPAISIPVRGAGSFLSAEARGAKAEDPALPVGLQLIARRGDDDKLLRIARRLTEP